METFKIIGNVQLDQIDIPWQDVNFFAMYLKKIAELNPVLFKSIEFDYPSHIVTFNFTEFNMNVYNEAQMRHAIFSYFKDPTMQFPTSFLLRRPDLTQPGWWLESPPYSSSSSSDEEDED